MKKYFKIFLLFPILALFTVQSFAQSSAGYQYLEPGQKQTFNFQNICREITNNSSSRILIPSQSLNEYGSFLAYPPSGVVIEPCCSSLQDKEAYEYEACPDGTNGSKYRKVTVDYPSCTSFNGVFEDESPPSPKYGPWQGSCSVCPTSPGCGFGYDRNDYCAEWNPVVVVAGVPQPQTCKKWDFTCNYNCNNTTPKATEQFNKSQANICGGFPDITNRSDVIHGYFNNYGNATGLTIPGYELSRGSCTQSMTCSATIQTRAIEVCPVGYIMQTSGSESRTLNQNNVCGNHSPFAVTLAPVCILAPSVNGVCGTSNGGSFANKPTSDLCSQGVASSVATMPDTWNWNCSGSGAGSNASCQADIIKPQPPVPGPACNNTTTGAPTPTQACTVGVFSNLNLTPDGKTYTWKCSNPVDSNDSLSCTSSNIITPVCGSANNSAAIVEPDASALCSTGSAKSFIKDGNVWKWSCEGNVAADVSCSTQAVNMCTSQFYEVAYELNSTTNEKDSVQIYCPAGKQFKYQYKSFTMVGPNTNIAGSFSANYYANLNDANNSTSTYCEDLPSGCSQTTGGEWCAIWNSGWGSVPATNGTKPTNSTVYSDSGMYAVGDGSKGKPFAYWPNCTVGEYAVNSGIDIVGGGGSTQTYFKCIAPADNCGTHVVPPASSGVCGSANGVSVMDVPTTNLCSYGSVTSGPLDNGTKYDWVCQGDSGTTGTSCSAPKGGTNYTEQCKQTYTCSFTFVGDSHTVSCPTGYVAQYPNYESNKHGPYNANFCLSDTQNAVCVPRPASCGAEITPKIGACGSANGVSVFGIPTTNLCSYGSVTSGPLDNGTKYDWVCQGDNGTTGTSCSAPKSTSNSCLSNFNCTARNSDGSVYSITQNMICPSGQYTSSSSATVPLNYPSIYTTPQAQCSALVSSVCSSDSSCSGGGGGTGTPGSCGTSDGKSFSSTPNSNLCDYGNSSSVSLTGSTYSWTCQGDNGTTAKSCTATKTENLVCNTVFDVFYPNFGNGFTKTYQCDVGFSAKKSSFSIMEFSTMNDLNIIKQQACEINSSCTSLNMRKTCTWTSKENLDDVRSWCYTRQNQYQQTGLNSFCDGINVTSGETQIGKSDGTFEHTNCIDDPIPGFDKTFDYCTGLNSDFTMAQNLECIEN